MACGSCSNKNRKKYTPKNVRYTVMGNYKYLTRGQINKRLETFKRIYCKDCDDRYHCDYEMYDQCTKVDKGE